MDKSLTAFRNYVVTTVTVLLKICYKLSESMIHEYDSAVLQHHLTGASLLARFFFLKNSFEI
jgi:hypothetical protein